MDRVPERMKAVLLNGHGGLDQLEYRDDVAVPRPAQGEVLIRIKAAGVNNTDINTRIGWYSKSVKGGTGAESKAKAEDSGWMGKPLAFPRIQGADGAGRIVEVGEDVDPTRIGQRVLVEPVFRRPEAPFSEAIYFGSECNGAFAEYACVPARHAHAINCGLSDAELASFPCSSSAAENMIERAGVRAGQTIIVTGASGGVGSAAVQLACRRGASVVAIAAAAKADEVKGLGASRVLPRDADISAELGRESADAVIDSVGGAVFPALLNILKRGGRYATVGAIAGPIVELDLRTLYLKDLTLLGCTVLEPQIFPNLVGYIERGEIRPVVSATYPLHEIARAQREFMEKRHIGKIVLTI